MPCSVDPAAHRVVSVGAGRSVLGRCSVAQRRMPVPPIVVGLEIADHHPRLEQAGPVIAVQALGPQSSVVRNRRLNDSTYPLFQGVPGGM